MTYPTLQPPGAGSIHPALARHHWLHRRTHAAVAVPARHRSPVQSPRNAGAHGDAVRRLAADENHHRAVREIARIGGLHHHGITST